jgi:hypothetical protein
MAHKMLNHVSSYVFNIRDILAFSSYFTVLSRLDNASCCSSTLMWVCSDGNFVVCQNTLFSDIIITD